MSVGKRKGSPFYQYEFRIKGHRFRGSAGETSHREALAYERGAKERARAEIAAGLVRADNPTIDDVFGRYWEAHGHKLAWAHAIKLYCAEMLAFWGAEKPFCDIGKADVSAMLEHCAKKTTYRLRGGGTREAAPPVDSTINRRLFVFRAIYYKARDEWDMPVKTIVFKTHKRKEPKARVRHITVDRAKEVMRELPPHILVMVAWSLTTGCRLNETETLEWARVNYETLQAEVNTKGGGTRFIDLGPDTLQILALCDRNRRLVFDSTNRRKLWEEARAKAELGDFTWHDLRHTFATWLGQRGAGLHVVQQALGHQQIETTMRYLHVIRGDVKAAVAKMPTLIEGPVTPMKKTDGAA